MIAFIYKYHAIPHKVCLYKIKKHISIMHEWEGHPSIIAWPHQSEPTNGFKSASSHLQELGFIEFYAGKGEVFKAVRGASVSAAKIDIEYIQNLVGGQNPMDVNSNAGLASLNST